MCQETVTTYQRSPVAVSVLSLSCLTDFLIPGSVVQQQEEARAAQDTAQEAAEVKAKAQEARKRMFGTLRPKSPAGLGGTMRPR